MLQALNPSSSVDGPSVFEKSRHPSSCPLHQGLPHGSDGKESARSVGDLGLIQVRKISWRREWQPTPVFLPGESHGWRSLVGYSPRSCKEWDVTDTTQRLTPQSSPFCVNIQNSSNRVICRFLVALLKAVTHKVHECFLVKIFNDTDKHKDFCSLFSFGPLSRENFSYQYGVYVSRRTFSLHICGYGNKWKL